MARLTFEGLAAAFSPRRWEMPALATAVALQAGCTINTSAPVIVASGKGAVIVDWTLRGADDPDDCQVSGATTLHVSLSDSSGALPMEYVQDCAAFATTIGDLVPDVYTGTVELLDSSGNPRTTSVNLVPFRVISDTTITLAVDFPASSFF
jgi:hypothetical protein